MSTNHATREVSGWMRYAPAAVVVIYSLWAVLTALHNGVFNWGALGDYSLCPYMLVIGLISSGVVFLNAMASRSLTLEASFIALFFGFGGALLHVRPTQAPATLGWVFDFVAFTAGFSVLAAAVVIERRIRSSRP